MANNDGCEWWLFMNCQCILMWYQVISYWWVYPMVILPMVDYWLMIVDNDWWITVTDCYMMVIRWLCIVMIDGYWWLYNGSVIYLLLVIIYWRLWKYPMAFWRITINIDSISWCYHVWLYQKSNVQENGCILFVQCWLLVDGCQWWLYDGDVYIYLMIFDWLLLAINGILATHPTVDSLLVFYLID